MSDYYKPQAFFPVVPEGGLFGTSTTPRTRLGTKIWDINGNAYRYIKANAALKVGRAVSSVAEGAWDTGTLAAAAVAAGDTSILVDTNTSAWTANQYAGYFVTQASAAAKGYMYEIKGHDAAEAAQTTGLKVQLVHASEEVFANNVALRIYNPYLMAETASATLPIEGVTIGAIASGSYGWIQVGGTGYGIMVEGSTGNPSVVGEPLVPIATPTGSVQGRDGSAEADIVEMGLSPLVALRASAVDDSFIPFKFAREV